MTTTILFLFLLILLIFLHNCSARSSTVPFVLKFNISQNCKDSDAFAKIISAYSHNFRISYLKFSKKKEAGKLKP